MSLGAFFGLLALLAALDLGSTSAVPHSLVTRCTTLKIRKDDRFSDFYPVPVPKAGTGEPTNVTIEFQVTAERDAFIAFYPNSSAEESEAYYVVLLGNWNNTKSYLTKYLEGYQDLDGDKRIFLALNDTSDLLSATERNNFRITVTQSGNWTVSKQNYGDFLIGQDTEQVPIRYFRLGNWGTTDQPDTNVTWVFNCTENDGEADRICDEARKEIQEAKADSQIYLRNSMIQRKVLTPPENVEILLSEIDDTIVALNDVEAFLVAELNLKLSWNDSRLSWNPSEFRDEDYIVLSPDDIWTPNITAFEDVFPAGTAEPSSEKGSILVSSDGDVTWDLKLHLTVPCSENWRVVCEMSLGDATRQVPFILTPQRNTHERKLSNTWTATGSLIQSTPSAAAAAAAAADQYTILYHVFLSKGSN